MAFDTPEYVEQILIDGVAKGVVCIYDVENVKRYLLWYKMPETDQRLFDNLVQAYDSGVPLVEDNYIENFQSVVVYTYQKNITRYSEIILNSNPDLRKLSLELDDGNIISYQPSEVNFNFLQLTDDLVSYISDNNIGMNAGFSDGRNDIRITGDWTRIVDDSILRFNTIPFVGKVEYPYTTAAEFFNDNKINNIPLSTIWADYFASSEQIDNFVVVNRNMNFRNKVNMDGNVSMGGTVTIVNLIMDGPISMAGQIKMNLQEGDTGLSNLQIYMEGGFLKIKTPPPE